MKKTENISFRTTTEIKEALTQIATPKKWSLSLLVEDIVAEWLKEHHPELITETDE